MVCQRYEITFLNIFILSSLLPWVTGDDGNWTRREQRKRKIPVTEQREQRKKESR